MTLIKYLAHVPDLLVRCIYDGAYWVDIDTVPVDEEPDNPYNLLTEDAERCCRDIIQMVRTGKDVRVIVSYSAACRAVRTLSNLPVSTDPDERDEVKKLQILLRAAIDEDCDLGTHMSCQPGGGGLVKTQWMACARR